MNQSGNNEHILQSPGADKLAEQLTKRFLAAAQDMERFKKEQELSPGDAEISFYKTNPDGSVVTMDAEGRTTALSERGGRQVYQFVYRNKQSKEPDSIKLTDGTTLTKRVEISECGQQSSVIWTMNPNDQTKDFTDFPNSALTINKDGSFKIKYRCMIASAIKRDEVVREISFTVRGKRVAEFEKVAYARVGPKNAFTVREGLVKRVSG
ncbi:MAG: hypothetical protein K2X93_00920 [Candidatus Obscuribacterales bacterium]|nr:hypothetical protein [Candidatus Obscuribacterales bacterium]